MSPVGAWKSARPRYQVGSYIFTTSMSTLHPQRPLSNISQACKLMVNGDQNTDMQGDDKEQAIDERVETEKELPKESTGGEQERKGVGTKG